LNRFETITLLFAKRQTIGLHFIKNEKFYIAQKYFSQNAKRKINYYLLK